ARERARGGSPVPGNLLPHLVLLDLVAAKHDELARPEPPEHELHELPAEGAGTAGDEDALLGPVHRWAPPFRSARYHSTVRRRPSSKPVRARKPNQRSARLVSTHRRGCPVGFLVSPTMAPVKPVTFATACTSSWMLISIPQPRLTGP